MRPQRYRLRAAALGAVSFVLVHLGLASTWASTFGRNGVTQAWFLNSGAAVLATTLGLFVIAFLFGCLASDVSKFWLSNAIAMSVGVAIGMCAVLAVIGLGNLWPIVIVVGLVVTAPPVVLGVGAGAGLRRLSARRHDA